MPNNRRRTRQAQPETPAQNDPAVTPEPIPESGPIEGAELEHGVGETPAAAVAEDGGHEEQTAAEEGQNAGEDHTQAGEEQSATEAPGGQQLACPFFRGKVSVSEATVPTMALSGTWPASWTDK